VARVLQNGYLLKERLLRPAKVMVTSTPEQA
jgi:molecular chaperone GrpE (heat shock protein)